MLMDFMGPMIPITAIFMGIACAILAMYFHTKRQKEEQETIRHAIEKGVDIPEDLLRKIDSHSCCDYHSRSHPLRRGIFWTMVGISLVAALWVSQGLEEAVWGGIPLAVGIGFLIYHKMMPEPDKGRPSASGAAARSGTGSPS